MHIWQICTAKQQLFSVRESDKHANKHINQQRSIHIKFGNCMYDTIQYEVALTALKNSLDKFLFNEEVTYGKTSLSEHRLY